MTGTDDIGTQALGRTIAGLLRAPAQLATGLAGALARRGSQGCGCEIPPPCWEPRRAGTCCLVLSPGSTGTIRVHVENCDWTRHVVAITALGRLAAWISFSPTTLVVDPQERASFLVTLLVPTSAKPGQTLSGPLIVRGCIDHAVRLEVTVAACAERCDCGVVVRDCPDQVHHWYDHFYCPRPCRSGNIRDVRDG